MRDWVSKMDQDLIDTLDSHFRCLGEPVTCSRVKPCLPGLLLPSVQLRIPTPITVHIDQCRECAADLGALRGLALDAGQLARLQGLYSQRPENRPLLCCRARSRIREFVAGAWERIDDKVLDHLCTCPSCRAEVYACRQRLLEEGLAVRRRPGRSFLALRTGPGPTRGRPRLERTSGLRNEPNQGWPGHIHARLSTSGEVGPSDAMHRDCRELPGPAAGLASQAEPGTPDGCGDHVGTGDLFDYAVPWGRADRPGVSHVGACPRCLARIQRLHRVIYDIDERLESGVATVYTTVDDAGPVAAQPDDPYARNAVRVQITRRNPQPAVVAASCERAAHAPDEKRRRAWGTGRLQRAGFDPRVRMILKTAVTAAAVIPLAMLFLSTRSAAGLTLADVVDAFERAQNIRVLRYGPREDQITQELLILRESNLVYMARPGECIMYDLGGMKRAVVGPGSRLGQTVSLSDHEYAGVRDIMDSCLGLKLTKVASDACWDRVSDDEKAYKLTWADRMDTNRTIWFRWEVALDESTRRPIAASLFMKDAVDMDWRRMSWFSFAYMSDAEMRSVIERGPLATGTGALP